MADDHEDVFRLQPAAARSARAIIGWLPILCRTLAWLLFILVPRPAARISVLIGLFTASSSGRSTTNHAARVRFVVDLQLFVAATT